MGLSKKTLCYSIIIATLLMGFIVIYFSLMLPPLYVDYAQQRNLESVVNVQKAYMETGSYAGIELKNPTGSCSIEIPNQGDQITIAGKAFKVMVELEDPELQQILEQFRNMWKNTDDYADMELPDIDTESLKDKFLLQMGKGSGYPVSIKAEIIEDVQDMEVDKMKAHVISDSIVVFEGGVRDGDNQYTTYIAAGKTGDGMVFSFLPIMTPQMKEIRPIVLGSLPMLTAVVFLLVLIASQLFAKRIVNPVIRLARYAQEVEEAEYSEMEPLEIHGKDEIGELGSILNGLYARLRMQYLELQEKNQVLFQENKRQEVFLRASSHQLKTPITAALLLVEGMMQQVGKYKNTEEYLPEVKKQLLSMRKIVEDILYLNHCTDHIETQVVDVELLLKEVVEGHRVQAAEKRLDFQWSGTIWPVETDREIMKKILDNLIANAVSYTPEGQEVELRLGHGKIQIYNHGGHIEEELLPHIYEPFVSSDTRQKGRGLGLYVISYYAKILGCRVNISNEKDGVLSQIEFGKEKK